MKEFTKHLKLMGLFTKRYIMSQMEYRTSFFTILIVESLILFSKLLYTVVVYNTDMIVDGLKPEAITMFTGTFFIISAVYGALFMFNFTNLQNSVYDGSLDIAITKPISLQFYLTVSTIDLAVPIPNFIAGVIMVSNAWKTLQLSTEPFIIAGYVFYIILGVVMLYSILLLPPLLSFWFVKSEGISQIVSGLSNFNMMPMAIYPKALKFFGTFIIPIFIVSNFPPLFVLGRLNIGTQIWGIVAPMLFFGGARIVFKKAIRKYSSIAN